MAQNSEARGFEKGPLTPSRPEAGQSRGWSSRFLENFATADPRSLGLLRIALGLLLLVDLLRRWPDLVHHYSNSGWLTNHFMLFRPMSSHLFSLYLAAGPLHEVRLFFVLHVGVYVAFLVGWRTKLMHALSLVMLVSLNSRNIMLENGGWVVLTLLTVWTLFLPLGRRFSVDAWNASVRWRTEGTIDALNDRAAASIRTAPVRSLAVTALILQWAVIYYFNAVHKNGPPWKNGTAVYYFFQQDRMVTEFGGWLRHVVPLWGIRAMTWGALVIEFAVVVLLLVPLFKGRGRLIAWLLVALLHLSIDAVVQLGPFSWAMVIMFFGLIEARVWGTLAQRWTRRRSECTVHLDPSRGEQLFLGRVIKRLDPFALIRFQARLPAQHAWVAAEKGEVSGAAAVAAVARRMPAAWVLAAPGVRWLVAGALRRLGAQRQRLSRAFRFDAAIGTDRRRPSSPFDMRVGRLRCAVAHLVLIPLMLITTLQVLAENRAVPAVLKPNNRPSWSKAIVIYPRMFQGWSMFAPSPPKVDGRIVVDGRTADGRKWDPLQGEPPSFDMNPRLGFGMNQIWGDFHRRIADERFSAYQAGFKNYLLRHHEVSGRQRDRLVAFDVWMVEEDIPEPGAKRAAPKRRKLFSHGIVKP